MSTLLFVIGAFVFYVLCANTAAYVLGRMSLSWKHSALLALLFIAVSALFEWSPFSSVAVGGTTLSTLLLLPTIPAIGAWFLKGRLSLKTGQLAGVGARILVTMTPVFAAAVIGIAFVLINARTAG